MKLSSYKSFLTNINRKIVYFTNINRNIVYFTYVGLESTKGKLKRVMASLAKKKIINFKTNNIKCSSVTLNDNNFTVISASNCFNSQSLMQICKTSSRDD